MLLHSFNANCTELLQLLLLLPFPLILLLLLLLLLLQNSRLSSWCVNYELVSTTVWKEYSYKKECERRRKGIFIL